jgi:hypothetical protein
MHQQQHVLPTLANEEILMQHKIHAHQSLNAVSS